MKRLDRNIVLETLKGHKQKLLEQFHVKNIALFGSFARNEALPQSDIDILVEFDVPLEKYISNRRDLKNYLESLFGRPIDLANPNSLKPFYKQIILKQAIYA